MTRREPATAAAMLAFPLAVLFVFTLIPTIAGVGLALFRWDGGAAAPTFVGLANFRELAADPRFGAAFGNTVVYALASVPLTVALAFLIAAAVFAPWFRGRGVVRTLLFIPTVISIAAIGFIWRWVLNDQSGLLNWALARAGVGETPRWLSEGRWPFFWIIVVSIWRQIGFAVVLYLSALGSIDASRYEAAEIDGASRLGLLRHVTWPGVAGTTAFLLAALTIGALQAFDIVFVMTAGQETASTTVLNLEVYRKFTYGAMGPAAALGAVILTLTLPAAWWQLRGRREP